MTAPIQIHPTAALREVTALAEHYRQRNLALAHDLLVTTQENEDLKAKLAEYEPAEQQEGE